MTTPESDIHQRLQTLFRGLDAAPDFDARLMLRLRTEGADRLGGAGAAARRREQERHSKSVRELGSWRRSMLRLLTFDTLAIGGALVVASVAAWPHVGPLVVFGLRQYGVGPSSYRSGFWLQQCRSPGMWAERLRATAGLS